MVYPFLKYIVNKEEGQGFLTFRWNICHHNKKEKATTYFKDVPAHTFLACCKYTIRFCSHHLPLSLPVGSSVSQPADKRR